MDPQGSQHIPAQRRRLYQLWKGNNVFLFGGRLFFGPDAASLFLSASLIVGPAITFCIKIGLIIKSRLEDRKNVIPWYSILAVGCFLTILDMVFLLLTSSRDPGIIPRNSSPPDSSESFNINTPSMEWVNDRTPHLKLPRSKDVIINGHAVRVKYCDTCLLYRPPRASHCSICNNCVQKFDHHCPWVGQCIGIRNYRFFYMFISTSTILCLYVFGISWLNIVQHEGNVWKGISDDILSDFLIVYCFIAVWFVGGLTGFHFYLICTNQTTYENFRYKYDAKANPYNKGMLDNIKEVFFSKIPPSKNQFRAFVVEEGSIHFEPNTIDMLEGIASSKDKIDIELGLKPEDDGGFSLPEIASSKDKIDIELGLKPEDDGGFSLPEILRDLDCQDMEEITKSREFRRTDTDPNMFTGVEESRESIFISAEVDHNTDSEPSCLVVPQESISGGKRMNDEGES